ncbi:MAG: hypothetical protein F6K42_12230 [Leptolyngbya sp. SIO1D8]|nr:hypothetical protein [Leptolyngbya sp. SIO1D8]
MDLEKSVPILNNAVLKTLEKEEKKPFIVSVIGQTGVGKSSLINALFSVNLATDPVQPCTKEIEKIIIKGNSNYELWFYDLPGIGESEISDKKYIDSYRDQLLQSDVVIWSIHSDNRSTTFDSMNLKRILSSLSDDEERSAVISKLIFVLTKVDLLTPPPWIFVKRRDIGKFIPNKETRNILDYKAKYYQSTFLKPHAEIMTSKTYLDHEFRVDESQFSCDSNYVYCKGILSEVRLSELQKKYPDYTKVFERLYVSQQILPCSSLFRFGLYEILLAVINKLGKNAIFRFRNFLDDTKLDEVSLVKARNYCNILIFDQEQEKTIFDLSKQEL